MKKIKRLLSFLLTMVLMAVLLPVTTASAGLSDFNKNETDKLRSSLNANSVVAGSTAFIDLSGTSLSGSLDLSGFSSLSVTVYTVTFDLQGGYRVGGGDLVQQVPQGSASIAPIAERANYDFAGWDQEFKAVTGNLTVKALWSPRPTSGSAFNTIPLSTVPTTTSYPITFYTVNFDLNGGIHTDSTPLEQMIQEGGYAYAPAVIKPGYRLVGWDTDFSNIRSNIYTKAIWEEIIIIHEVLFDVNRGIRIGGGDIIQEIVEGNAAQAPEVMRPGYTFEGWDVPFDKVVSDLTVTASWKKAEAVEESEIVRYTVTYDANGGEGPVPDTEEFEEGEMVELDDGFDLSLDGYEFIGWAFSSDGEVIPVIELTVEENVTLFAIWDEVEVTEAEPEKPTAEPIEPSKDVIPKTGIQSEAYMGIVMLLFGSGIVVNEVVRRRKMSKRYE